MNMTFLPFYSLNSSIEGIGLVKISKRNRTFREISYCGFSHSHFLHIPSSFIKPQGNAAGDMMFLDGSSQVISIWGCAIICVHSQWTEPSESDGGNTPAAGKSPAGQ